MRLASIILDDEFTLNCRPTVPMEWSRYQSTPTAAFSSFRMNTRREGLGDCLYRFGSACPDLGGPIRLQNVSDVTRSNSWATRSTSFFEFSTSGYRSKATSIVEKVFSSLKQQKECHLAGSWHRVGGLNARRHVHLAFLGSKTVWAVSQTLPPCVYPERTKRCDGSSLACEITRGVWRISR
jgi:hypothetical protein